MSPGLIYDDWDGAITSATLRNILGHDVNHRRYGPVFLFGASEQLETRDTISLEELDRAPCVWCVSLIPCT